MKESAGKEWGQSGVNFRCNLIGHMIIVDG